VIDQFVALSDLLDLLGDLCPDCQEKLRKRMASPGPMVPLRPGLKKIIEDVCVLNGVTLGAILSKAKDRKLVEARREVVIKARMEGYSLPMIGRALNKHHTSILHLLRTTKKLPPSALVLP